MKKKLIVFLAVCFAISFGAAGVFKLLGGVYASPLGTAFVSLYMLIPTIAVAITQFICKEEPFTGIGFNFHFNKWWIVGWLVMPVFNILAMLLSTLLPGVALDPDSELVAASIAQMAASGMQVNGWGLFGITMASSLLAGATINTVFALGEEIAWRGFLPRVMEECGFWKKSLVIGVIWGLWHMPVILMGHNYPQHPVAGVFMMVAFCTALTPIMLHLREKAGSTIVPAIAHGTMNASAGISVIYLAGGSDLLSGSTGAVGIVTLGLIDLLIYFQRKKAAAKSSQ